MAILFWALVIGVAAFAMIAEWLNSRTRLQAFVYYEPYIFTTNTPSYHTVTMTSGTVPIFYAVGTAA